MEKNGKVRASFWAIFSMTQKGVEKAKFDLEREGRQKYSHHSTR